MKGNIPATDESMIPALENENSAKETDYIFPMLGDGVTVIEVVSNIFIYSLLLF